MNLSDSLQNCKRLFTLRSLDLGSGANGYIPLQAQRSFVSSEVIFNHTDFGSGYLHLAYFGVTTLLLRRLVRSTALAPLCLDMSVLNAVRQYAYDTAQKATALVASLRPEHLDAFWYFGMFGR